MKESNVLNLFQSMLNRKKVPKIFWAEALTCATYNLKQNLTQILRISLLKKLR